MSKRSIIFLSLFTLNFNVVAASHTFEHTDCKIRFIPGPDKDLDKIAKKKLQELNFEILPLINNKAMLAKELYYKMELSKDQKIYKSCIITSKVRVAQSRLARSTDKILFSKAIKRSLPRVTFSGYERCKMALQETFIHIPVCKK